MLGKKRRSLEFDELEARLVPALLGKQLFPADNAWNQRITNAPVASNSGAIISNIGVNTPLHPDFGQRYGTHDDLYGIPINIVSGSHAKVPVIIGAYPGQSDPGDVPIPANAVIEGDWQDGPKAYADKDGGDSHLIVWDKDNNIAYELYHASRPSDNPGDNKWHADGQAIWDMKKNTFRTLGWTSADAAGLSILAGLARPDEGLPVDQGGQGIITHAIRFTITNSKVLGKYIYPASHEANNGNTPSNMPPMGTRFRLKAGVDISNFFPQSRIVAQAMKDYGLILADNGSSMYFTGASASVDASNQVTLTWNDDDIQSSSRGLKALRASDFEVVDLRPRVTGLSHATAAPGSTITVTGQNFSGSASSGGPNRLFVLFGSTAVAATYISDTQVSAVVPSGSGTVAVKVRSGIVEAESGNFLNPVFGYGESTTSANFTFATGPSFPSVQSIVRASTNPTNAASVAFTVTFSAGVTGVDSGDFALTASGVSGATIANLVGSGTTYTVTVDTGSGNGTLRLDVTDNDSIQNGSGLPLGGSGIGNGNFTSGQAYSIDKSSPAVSSVVRAGSNPTGAASVAFTVTFSEAVTGVNAADFDLTTSGVSGATIGTITGSGTTWTVNVSTGSGSGTIRLDVTDDDSIQDGVNPLGGSGAGNGNFTGGQTYTIDKPALTVNINETAGQANPVVGGAVLFTVVFSAAVSDFIAADVTVSGSAEPHMVTITGGGTTYTVAVSGMKRAGVVIATIAGGVASDGQGTFNNPSGSIDNTVAFVLPPDRVAIFRKGKWWRDLNGDETFNETAAVLGKAGDRPLRGDFNGDGVEESGVFRGYGKWLIDRNHDGKLNDGLYAVYGTLGDLPAVGDWDGDGDDDIGIFRQGRWWLDDGDRIKNDARIVFGKKGDQRAIGDWDGDGDDDIGIFRAGLWFWDSNHDHLLNDASFATYGSAGDKAAAGDWDGDGTTDLGLFRKGRWFCDDGDFSILNEIAFRYGAKGDVPLAGK